MYEYKAGPQKTLGKKVKYINNTHTPEPEKERKADNKYLVSIEYSALMHAYNTYKKMSKREGKQQKK